MRKQETVLVSLALLSACALAHFVGHEVLGSESQGSPAGQRPNFLVVLADDLGYGDLACYGHQVIQTPNLDGLAANGIRFTQFFNTARCCPTRASLMTGLYSHRASVGHMMGDYGVEGYRGDLSKNAVTIAEALKAAGYGAVTTQIADAPTFWYAEGYHQQYLAKNPMGYCGLGGTGVTIPATGW